MGNLTRKNGTKKRMILGVVIAMLGASSASAEELSPSARQGAGDAKLITELVLLLRTNHSGMNESKFGPCEQISDNAWRCGRLYYTHEGDTITNLFVTRMAYVPAFDLGDRNIGEYVAAAVFRFNDLLAQDSRGAKDGSRVWTPPNLPRIRFYVTPPNHRGFVWVGVKIPEPPEEKKPEPKKEPKVEKKPAPEPEK